MPTMPQLKAFVAAHSADMSKATQAIKQSIETGEANTEWMKKSYEDVENYLKKQ